jgi:hypothetical protein
MSIGIHDTQAGKRVKNQRVFGRIQRFSPGFQVEKETDRQFFGWF